ncbi:MAG: hypothetical protein LBK94_07145 [Prevotellaceae bacterium]|nr:hypothetical protein [Prevotellaceae bacterium]
MLKIHQFIESSLRVKRSNPTFGVASRYVENSSKALPAPNGAYNVLLNINSN